MITGLILIILGLVLRYLAYLKLGKDFKLTLEKPRIIRTDGVYRYIRHPSYAGSLLIILGCAILSSALGILALSWAFFLARIVKEEKMLSKFPEYKEYQKRTGKIIPKLRKDK